MAHHLASASAQYRQWSWESQARLTSMSKQTQGRIGEKWTAESGPPGLADEHCHHARAQQRVLHTEVGEASTHLSVRGGQ